MDEECNLEAFDLANGIALSKLIDGRIMVGRFGKSKVFVSRDGENVRAFGVECPHLGASLDEGLIDAGVVRCPWHHACFDLITGAALTAPAFDPLTRREATIKNGVVFISERAAPAAKALAVKSRADALGPMVIVGGGAAGFAAADALRSQGWRGEIVLLSADPHPPYDRTLLTKDFLDGHFGDDRLPIALHDLNELGVRLRTDASVEAIDVEAKMLKLRDGVEPYGKLLLATGAAP